MAHFAQLNENNIVINVLVVDNNDCKDANGNESEQVGIDFLKKLFPDTVTNWAQTSYNSNFRKKYAGIDDYFDSQRNAFLSPKPYESWVLNENICIWEPPVAIPADWNLVNGIDYIWDESVKNWIRK